MTSWRETPAKQSIALFVAAVMRWRMQRRWPGVSGGLRPGGPHGARRATMIVYGTLLAVSPAKDQSMVSRTGVHEITAIALRRELCVQIKVNCAGLPDSSWATMFEAIAPRISRRSAETNESSPATSLTKGLRPGSRLA